MSFIIYFIDDQEVRKSTTVLIDIIDKISNTNNNGTDKTYGLPDANYEKHSLYSGKSVSKINHLTSDTFYTSEYIETLVRTLGDPGEFANSSQYERHLIQTAVESLSHDDYILKTYLHKSIHESKNLHDLFPESFSLFKEGMNKVLSGTDTQRGYRLSFKFKYKTFYEKIIDLLVKKNYQIEFAREMSDSDVDTILKEYLTPSVIFDGFCVILLKSARNTLLSNSKNQFNSVNMSVLHHQVIYSVYRHMVISSIAHGITHKATSKKIVLPLDSIIRSVRNFLLHENPMISVTSEYKLFIDGIDSLFNSFATSGLFTNITKENYLEKRHIRYYFPTELSENLGRYTTPPRVYRSGIVTRDNITDSLIPTNFGKIEITPSVDLIEALNISNKKRFSININFLNILSELEVSEHLEINYPIPSKIEIENAYNKKENNDFVFDKFSSYVVDMIQSEISKRQKELSYKYQYRYLVNLTKAEYILISERQINENKYKDLSVERRGGITRLVLSAVLEDFPLYYTNTLCSTTRAFVKEYLISRHIGCLKLLRGEFKLKHVSTKGIIHMLRAYYSEDVELLGDFEGYLISKGSGICKKVLKSYYESNRINYANKKSVSHFMLLSVELKQVFRCGKTKLLLQFDQVASGLVFISILFKNVELAEKTFVIYKEGVGEGPYAYAMNKIKSFYDLNVTEKNDEVISFVSSSKKLHKYALMCYAYNQSTHGRTQDFTDIWFNHYDRKPTNSEWKCLQSISHQYVNFINELFPGVDNKFKTLDKIVELVVRNVGYLKIRTVDGSLVAWRFYKTKRHIRKSFDPHSMVPENYALYTGVVDDQGLPLIDIKQFKVKFRSYLIHSVDAGVMRLIVNRMYNNHKYKIDQLHDCMLITPNQVDNFYETIEDIYKDEHFKDYMNTHVFSELRSTISSDYFATFDTLVEEFNLNTPKSFTINGDFRSIYTPEV